MIIINLLNADKTLVEAASELSKELGFRFEEAGIPVSVKKIKEGLTLEKNENGITIGYSSKCTFFRALGLLKQHIDRSDNFRINEKAAYDTLGPMIDCSRNAVLNLDTVKKLIRYFALMGFNFLMLYTEDTYSVEGYPYFGYMRGRYTPEEIRTIDRYADMFGIELIPCIQTLAHMNALLRWEHYKDITDVNDILLIDEEKTYQLLEAMFKSLSEMFSSRNINIGFDEAQLVGLGAYLEKHGYQDRTELLFRHLKRVIAICNKYGFKPMMWSDMPFRMAFGNTTCYEAENDFSREFLSQFPEEVGLIYWDYYSESQDLYDKKIKSHLKLKNKIIFAGGAWKWIGFTPLNAYSFNNSILALKSCRKHNIKDVIITAWGDDGNECSAFSVLPTYLLFAEDCYANKTDYEHLSERFMACTDIPLQDFMLLDLPNVLHEDEKTPVQCNPSKYLLYNDLLCGLLDRHVEENVYNDIYKKHAERLFASSGNNTHLGYIFKTLANLCDLLSVKSEIGIKIYKAYKEMDIKALREIADNTLPHLYETLSEFHKSVEKQWFTENKAFGFEVIDIRLGGLKQRVSTCIKRLQMFLTGEIDAIEELEEERLPFSKNPEEPMVIYKWSQIATASVL